MSDPSSSESQSPETPAAPNFPFVSRPVATHGTETVVNPERRGESAGLEGSAPPRPSGVWKRLFPPDTEGESDEYEPPAGVELDHFAIEERIGYGGMGAVFRAVDERLQRTVALKVLAPSQSRDPAAVRRFQNEACAAAQLDHDNIARVYHVGQAHGLHYIAYEYVFGTNIRDLIQRRRLELAEAITYTMQVAAALKHTSAAGVIHRDIKPSNIIVTPGGRAKLVDLGLARKATTESEEDLTLAGTTLGTFDYISPEQAKDPRNVDVRSDIYSLGCTLYHMLTGEPPYPEGTVLQKLLDHQGKEPPDPARKNRRVPENLSRVVQTMMASDPRQRYATAEQLYNDLVIVARSMGLQTVNPETTAWIPLARKSHFWERHLAWMATAAALLLSVFLLNQFGDEVRQAADQVSQQAGQRDSTETTAHDADTKPSGRRLSAGDGEGELSRSANENKVARSDDSGTGSQEPSPGKDGSSFSPDELTASPDEQASDAEAAPDEAGTSDRAESTSPRKNVSGGESSDSSPMPLAADSDEPRSENKEPSSSGSTRAEEEDDERPSLAEDRSQSSEEASSDPSGTRPNAGDASDSETGKTAQAGMKQADGDSESETVSADNASSGDVGEAESDADAADRRKFPPISIVSDEDRERKAFQTLEAACTEAEDGDVIELRFDGVRPAKRPVTIKNKQITIRGAGEDRDGNPHRPLLEFAPDDATSDERRMITVLDGSLNLHNVDLRMVLGEQASPDEWTLFSLEDAKRVRLENIAATVVNPGKRPAAFVSLRSGPGGSFDKMQMEMGQALVRDQFEVKIAESFVRGHCDLFVTENARPGRLQVTNSVVAVGGTVLTSYGDSDREGRDGSHIELGLDHVTGLTGKSLLKMDSGDLPRELLPVHVFAQNNILASDGGHPLVEMAGATNTQDFRALLVWTGQKNFYDGFRTYWSIASQTNTSGAQTMDFDDWTSAWDSREHHDGVVWDRRPGKNAFSELAVDDFRLDDEAELNPALSGATDGTDAGADLREVPPVSASPDVRQRQASRVRGVGS